MGAGRKTRTYPLKEKSQVHFPDNASAPARNLTKDKLGAVIFGCKNHTIMECLEGEIFGLPAPHHSYVKNVTVGLTLYLFNYSDRKLHGVFEAVSTGQMDINPRAWVATDCDENTPYPSQVRVRELNKCRPLDENEFKPIIASNYYTHRFFWFELDHEQNRRLMGLFLSRQLPKKVPRLKHVAKKNKAFELSSSNVNKSAVQKIKYGDSEEYSGVAQLRLRDNEDSDAPVGYTDPLNSGKKWSEFFKPSSSSCVVENLEDLTYDNVDLKSEFCYIDQSFASSSDRWSLLPPEDVECWKDGAKVDSTVEEINEDVQPLLCQDLDSVKPDITESSSENIKKMDEESELMPSGLNCILAEEKAVIDTNEKVRSGTDKPNIQNFEINHGQCNMRDKAFHKDKNAMPAVVLSDAKTSDCQDVITKLIQEVGVLKLSNVKQRLRIESLEHELVHDKTNVINNASPDFNPEELVYIVGGFNECSWLSDLSSYDPFKDNVVSLCPMTLTRSYASSAQLNGELYIFGGAHNGVWYDIVESYDQLNNQWTLRPGLNRKKAHMGGASMYETIFALGGSNETECFSEVELFDQHIGSWVSSEPMLEKRSSHAAANLNGALYVAGGYDGTNYLRSVERFDPRKHAWTSLSGMNFKRGSHSLVAYKEKLYAIGGYDGDTMLSSVEVFDPRIDSWMMVQPMKVSRGYFGAFVRGDNIYVIGGAQDNQVLDLVECYREGSGWYSIGVTALGKRAYFSTVVL